MGNSLLPFGIGLARDADDLRHLLLRHAADVSQERQILCQHTDHLLVCAIIIRREKESFHHTNLSEKCFLCSYCLRGLCPSVPTIELSIYPLLAPLLCIRPQRSKIQELNIVRQYIRILQRMALRLPGRVFLHLKDVPVDARDLHRNIVQMQPRLPEGNIDADVGIAPVTLRNALPDLLKLINIIHHTHAFYHKPA